MYISKVCVSEGKINSQKWSLVAHEIEIDTSMIKYSQDYIQLKSMLAIESPSIKKKKKK